MKNNIILAGNPNTGKTTLFNTLTKSNQKASNWHGVTVGTISKIYKFEGAEYNVTDIPGMYSLTGLSSEEKLAAKYLQEHKRDLVVNICDANNLERNLILTMQLVSEGYFVVLAVNMCTEASHDYKKLASILGITIVEIDARKTKSVNELKKIISKLLVNQNTQKNVVSNKKEYLKMTNSEIFKQISTEKKDNYKTTNKIDKILLNKFLFLPSFLCIIFAVFFITFGPVGEAFLSAFEWLMEKFSDLISSLLFSMNINPAVRSFFVDGLLNASTTVLSFVPQIVILMFFLNLLEDTGYMSRVAFMFDGALKKVGLTGKSLFSLMMGFGCTTSAVLTTRNLENKNLRKRTALLLPFASCTAKLPIFLVISSLFFENYKFLFVFLLYVFAIAISVVFACIYKKFIPQKNDTLVLEMPKYRIPNLKKISKDTFSVIAEFLVKVGTLILLFTSIIWVLQNFSCSFKFLNGENFEDSILYFVSSKLLVIFRLVGIESAGAVSALIFGLVAKELVVVGLCMINGTVGSIELLSQSLLSPASPCYFTPISSVVFLVFVLLYSPCISALGSIKNEFGRKTAIYVFVSQFLLSFVVSFLVYHMLQSVVFGILILTFAFLDMFAYFMIKYIRKKKSCGRDCGACRKICDNKKAKVVRGNM